MPAPRPEFESVSSAHPMLLKLTTTYSGSKSSVERASQISSVLPGTLVTLTTGPTVRMY